MKILIDAFGGDNSPSEIIAGTIDAVTEKSGFTAVLVGKEEVINAELDKHSFDRARVEVLHAEDVITCEEEPTLALRRKPNSSICVAFKELKENQEAVAFVSAGSTGAILVGATLKLGRLSGVNRPALCPIMPSKVMGKDVLLLDAGANADCKSINLCQFAVMGSAFAKAIGTQNPKVALLSNGTEDEKGNALNHEVFPVLKNTDGINFVGNMEARDILSGEYDVVVTDGFSGNIALKATEGAIKVMLSALKEEVYSSMRGKLGGFMLKKSLGKLRARLDYNKKGGALFLGVNKLVIKAHGSSKREPFKNAVIQAVTYAELDMINKIKKEFESIDFSAFTENK